MGSTAGERPTVEHDPVEVIHDDDLGDRLYRELCRSRAEVRGRGHDWDVADVLAVIREVFQLPDVDKQG